MAADEMTTERSGRFAHKVALITGVSDRGIGGAIARRLSNEGAALLLASRTEPKRLLEQLTKRRRVFHFVACDVTRENDVRAAVAACSAQFGRLDVLVNNAGIERHELLQECNDASMSELLDTNLVGAIRMTRAALPNLTSPGGAIVNISSAVSLGGCNAYSVYSAAKAGLNGFTQSLAWEVAPRGQRVVAVAPGIVLTGMVARYWEQASAETIKQLRACHPLDVGLASDVAAAVAFLASDEARWITGVTLPLGWAPSYPLPVEESLAPEKKPAEPPQ
jgi:NAD(P)-dependent dehydrogenase (short-subunit alcohol dehydrogenase family)